MAREQQIINGKSYISSRRAAEIAGYSTDYVGQLCRESRIECQRFHGKWYVEKESILNYQREAVYSNETTFNADNFNSKKYSSSSYSISPFASFTLVVALFAIIFNGTTSFLRSPVSTEIISNALNTVASVADNSHTLLSNVQSAFSSVADVGSGQAKAGLVVVPAAESSLQNEKIVQSISNSFSDPVTVHQFNDNSGTITPVFSSVDGHDYIYVMVPVNASSTKK